MRIAIIQSGYEDASHARIALTRAGHRCWIAATRGSLQQILGRITVDLLLVDWSTSDCTGLELAAWVREDPRTSLVTAFYSRHAEPDDITAAYASGACEYIVKPVEERELAARVFIQLARAYPLHFQTASYTVGPYLVDPVAESITYKKRRVELTSTEFKIAACLLKNIGRSLSRDYIHESASDDAFAASSRSLDSQISTIRIKLRLMPERGFQLRAIYGYGYRLDLTDTLIASADRRARDIDWSMISSVSASKAQSPAGT